MREPKLRGPGRPRRRLVQETRRTDCTWFLSVSGHANTGGTVRSDAPVAQRTWAPGRSLRELHERGSAAAAEARQGGQALGLALAYSMRLSYRLSTASSLSGIGPIKINAVLLRSIDPSGPTVNQAFLREAPPSHEMVRPGARLAAVSVGSDTFRDFLKQLGTVGRFLPVDSLPDRSSPFWAWKRRSRRSTRVRGRDDHSAAEPPPGRSNPSRVDRSPGERITPLVRGLAAEETVPSIRGIGALDVTALGTVPPPREPLVGALWTSAASAPGLIETHCR